MRRGAKSAKGGLTPRVARLAAIREPKAGFRARGSFGPGPDCAPLTGPRPPPSLGAKVPQAVSTSKMPNATPKRRKGLDPGNTPDGSFRDLVEEVRPQINRGRKEFFTREVRVARPLGAEVEDMVKAVRDLSLRGGKRLRPALVVAGLRTSGAVRPRAMRDALQVGLSLELLQTYFLIHDDWMDGDVVRRGGPSAHAWLTERLGSKQLGESSAILAGDFAATLATSEMLKLRVPQAVHSKLLDAFCTLQADAIRGQQLDVVGRAETVDTVYRLKTTSYTVRGPLRLGAILGGASAALLSALDRFAEPAGIAFQLNDDLLSVFGDPKKTGKPFASDIREGKRTELVNVALQKARGADHRTLERELGNRKSSEKALRRAVDVLETTGARAAVEKRIETLRSKAIDALGSRAFRADGRALLASAAQALSARKA